jgi:hypothetical protein
MPSSHVKSSSLSFHDGQFIQQEQNVISNEQQQLALFDQNTITINSNNEESKLLSVSQRLSNSTRSSITKVQVRIVS